MKKQFKVMIAGIIITAIGLSLAYGFYPNGAQTAPRDVAISILIFILIGCGILTSSLFVKNNTDYLPSTKESKK
jgi:hypothetical protein